MIEEPSAPALDGEILRHGDADRAVARTFRRWIWGCHRPDVDAESLDIPLHLFAVPGFDEDECASSDPRISEALGDLA